MLLSADPETISFIMSEEDTNRALRYFGHGDKKCPFLDLTKSCKHCNMPGEFLKGGFHFHSQRDNNDCVCCSQCEYKDFLNDDINPDPLIEFLALLTITYHQGVFDRNRISAELDDMVSRWKSVMRFTKHSSQSGNNY